MKIVMVYQTIFSTPLGQTVLAFVLMFTLVFAILQKSRILGEGKKQVDALVSLAIALIIISVGSALDFIQQIIPFMAIVLVILLVFMLLTASFFKEGQYDLPKSVKIGLGVIIFIAVVIAVLIFTGSWDTISNWFSSGNFNGNLILIVVIIVAVLLAYFGEGKPAEKKKES